MGFGQQRAEAARPLQAARFEIDWKQSQTLRELKQLAEVDKIPIASDASLKTMLSGWENGHKQPDPPYQRLLCKVSGLSASELGFVTLSKTSDLLRVTPAPALLWVDYFDNVFHQHVRADNLLGPHHLVAVVRAQVDLLDQVLPGTRGRLRDQL